MYQSQVHDVEKLLNIWHRLQQSAVQSEMDGERVYTAKGGHFELWEYANWVSGHWRSEAMFQIRRMYFSYRL